MRLYLTFQPKTIQLFNQKLFNYSTKNYSTFFSTKNYSTNQLMTSEQTTLLQSTYKGKKVFLTGHTGFKGSWMLYWLHQLGAEIKGYAFSSRTG